MTVVPSPDTLPQFGAIHPAGGAPVVDLEAQVGGFETLVCAFNASKYEDPLAHMQTHVRRSHAGLDRADIAFEASAAIRRSPAGLEVGTKDL